jgi:hypothetical protein
MTTRNMNYLHLHDSVHREREGEGDCEQHGASVTVDTASASASYDTSPGSQSQSLSPVSLQYAVDGTGNGTASDSSASTREKGHHRQQPSSSSTSQQQQQQQQQSSGYAWSVASRWLGNNSHSNSHGNGVTVSPTPQLSQSQSQSPSPSPPNENIVMPMTPRTYHRLKQKQKQKQKQQHQQHQHPHPHHQHQQKQRRVLVHHGHGTHHPKHGHYGNGTHSLVYTIIAVQLVLLLVICLGTLPYMLTLVHYSHSVVHDHAHIHARSSSSGSGSSSIGASASGANGSSSPFAHLLTPSQQQAQAAQQQQVPSHSDTTMPSSFFLRHTPAEDKEHEHTRTMSHPSTTNMGTMKQGNLPVDDSSSSETTTDTNNVIHAIMGYDSEEGVAEAKSASLQSFTTLMDDASLAPDVPLVDLDLPLIHIVNSRFMQDQAELLHLSEARLDLFETFCFPGMAGQTVQPDPPTGNANGDTNDDASTSSTSSNAAHIPTVDELKQYRFLWLLKVDPDLDEVSLQRLIELMAPHPNFFVLGSNVNYGIGVRPGSWRGGEAGAALLNHGSSEKSGQVGQGGDTTIYTGALPLLKYAHAARESKIVVETRLDADDGLPFHYLEAMGNTALEKLSPPDSPTTLDADALTTNSLNHQAEDSAHQHAKWLYWCAHESINWYPTAMYKGLKDANVEDIVLQRDPGRFTIDAKGHDGHPICLTPGLSTGLAVGVSYDDMPHIGHFTLMHDLQLLQSQVSCGLDDIRYCLHVVDMRPIRSRTPTSAGMKNLQLEGKGVSDNLVEKQWNYVMEVFGITKTSVYDTNLKMQRSLIHILQDNFKGQCTTGHSCKKDTKTTLLEMIRMVGGQAAVDELPSKPLIYQKKALRAAAAAQQNEHGNGDARKNGDTNVVDSSVKEIKQKLAEQLQKGAMQAQRQAQKKAGTP